MIVVILTFIHSVLSDCVEDTSVTYRVYVSSKVSNYDPCGQYARPCQTLKTAYQSLQSSGSTIFLFPGEQTSPTETVKKDRSSGTYEIKIQSCDTESPAVLNVNKEITLFTLKNTKLTVKDFAIAVTTANCLFQADSNNNYLTLNSMRIYGKDAPVSIT